jgi:hypothetical protein
MKSSHKRAGTVAALAAAAALATAAPARAEQVSFTDGADDAYRLPGWTGSPPAEQPPVPLLSDPKADILDVGFANLPSSKKSRNSRSYTATMTVSGPADAGYEYFVAGRFGSDCILFHSLRPGTTSSANAFCGSGETLRLIGRISGSAVTLTGTTLSATYTYTAGELPPELGADPQLGPLEAYTCVSGLYAGGCRLGDRLDFARTVLATFTI